MIKEDTFKVEDMILLAPKLKDFYRELKKSYQLSYEELTILYHVYKLKENTIPVRKLAERSSLKPYFLSKAIQKLKDKGYLDKKRSLIDQRQIYVEITDEQREHVRKLLQDLKKIIN
ncbi:MarR family transcriptional regulator [Staphylococcus sp. SQ8-PEA]|uniref:MarR family transcriptional regulator n=1 Tax=Staphylococcus marylandisciuri TaxID=2981529 RepID=A0ABT2QMK0_9STAP|nr:MarR family transcriptional regulator [Staphylococcus marylandisciuri]MCU5745200.1 MarR family transcriptional regulator [Staphylococcus marylandisciuri]